MVRLSGFGTKSSIVPLLVYYVEDVDTNDWGIREVFENFNGPEEVISFATSLKEKGNTMFKKKEFDSASNIYLRAIKILCIAITCLCEDLEECDRNTLHRKLIISLHLNLAACALNMNEVNKVVELCSLLLEIEGNNVKALFRRGIALIKLGKLDEAYVDLTKAGSLEPKNKVIIREIEELENSISLGSKKDVGDEQIVRKNKEVDIPCGLGQGLPLKRRRHLDNSREQIAAHHELHFRKSSDDCDGDQGLKDKSVSIGETELLKSSEKMVDFSEDDMLGTNDDKMEDAAVPTTPKNNNLAEPKFRFVNRRRPGSTLSISRKDYHSLRQGKSIYYCLSSIKSGSFIVVREAADKSRNHSDKKESSQVDRAMMDTPLPNAEEKNQQPEETLEGVIDNAIIHVKEVAMIDEASPNHQSASTLLKEKESITITNEVENVCPMKIEAINSEHPDESMESLSPTSNTFTFVLSRSASRKYGVRNRRFTSGKANRKRAWAVIYYAGVKRKHDNPQIRKSSAKIRKVCSMIVDKCLMNVCKCPSSVCVSSSSPNPEASHMMALANC